MKKAMTHVENIFCAGYLTFALIAGLVFSSRGDALSLRCAVMTFLLVGGDAFHLVPRIIANIKPEWEKKSFWLGIGNMISSITMTLFYVVLILVMDCFAPMPPAILPTICVLVVARIILCLMPANNWLTDDGNQKWRLYRNLPFLAIGAVTIFYLVAIYRQWLLAALVTVSFACYMTVVMGVKNNPKLGMMMIPKTICYIWMIGYFLI